MVASKANRRGKSFLAYLLLGLFLSWPISWIFLSLPNRDIADSLLSKLNAVLTRIPNTQLDALKR
jgi:hypothetical protein